MSTSIAKDHSVLNKKGLRELVTSARPDFLIGAHTKSKQLESTRVQAILRENYNLVSVGIYQKSTQRKGRDDWDFSGMDPIVDFAEKHGMTVYAHPMFGSDNYVPDWLLNGNFSDEELLEIIEDRIKTILTRYRGRIHILDVYNEGLHRKGKGWREEENRFLQLGYHENEIGKWPVALEKMLIWCRKYGGGDLKLIYNDNRNTHPSDQSEECIQLFKALKREGIPIDGIGIQCHTKITVDGRHTLNGYETAKGPVFDADLFAENLRAMGKAGIEVYISECDVHLYGEVDAAKLNLQADAYRSMLKVCMEEPACKSFKTWGFTDASCWKPMSKNNRAYKYEPYPLVFDHDLQPKPAYWSMHSLVTELAENKAQDRPNILFLFSDDQRWDTLGCVGGQVKTPHLDRLVEQGAYFTRAYNMGAWQGAVCIASRTMLMTGLDLWKASTYNNSNKRDKRDFWSTRFKEAGYKTYFAGKWHVSKIKPEAIYDVTGTVRPGMPDYFDPALGGRYPWNKRGAGYFRPQAPGQDNWDPSDPVYGGFWEGGKHWSEVLGDEGVGFIQEAAKSDQPFFMHLAFNAPHDPRQSPKKYVDMYPLDSIKVPQNFLPENPYAEAMEVGKGMVRDEDLAPFPRTEHAVKTHLQEYYAIITHMDEQIGRIMQVLEETGQHKNTIIVFTSDHGLGCGQHGLLGKQNLFDHSMKPPLIFCGKGIPKGKTIDTPVYMQDLMPTTMELAGLDIPDYIDFKSLLPVIDGREKIPYAAIYGAYKEKQRMVLQDHMKLIWYPDADTYLLFDIKKDPLEMNDLSSLPEYAETLKMLQVELKCQQEMLKDPLLKSATSSL